MEDDRAIIMLIDDDETCLAMGREILETRYTIYPVTSGAQAFALLEKISPDLILLDVEMPEMNGYDVIKRLKQDEETKDIPVIFLTSLSDFGSEFDGLTLGAIDYVTKPFPSLLLARRIENHLLIVAQRKELARYNRSLQKMVSDQTMEIKKLQNAILNTVSELVEFRDEMSGGHVERTMRYMQAMINAMKDRGVYKDEINSWDTEVLISATQMHDVGKICVSEMVLNKPGKVSTKEFDEIKKHAAYGSMIIDKMRAMTDNHTFLDYASIIADSHHERWDGSGYPEGRKGQNIPLAGRLMAVADVYDALVSSRPYKQPMSPTEAAERLIQGSGTAFDPALIEVFKSITDEFAKIAERQDILI